MNFTLYPSRPRFADWSTWGRNDVRALTRLCHEFVGARYSIEILHLEQEPERAEQDGISRIPAILVEMPSGQKRMLGGFAETKAFLRAQAINSSPASGVLR